jgi:hypothetical protein
MAKKKT